MPSLGDKLLRLLLFIPARDTPATQPLFVFEGTRRRRLGKAHKKKIEGAWYKNHVKPSRDTQFFFARKGYAQKKIAVLLCFPNW